jgi:hypothetical protein
VRTSSRYAPAIAMATVMLLASLAAAPGDANASPPGPGGYSVLGAFDNLQDSNDLLFDRPGYNNLTAVSLPNHAFVQRALVNMSFGTYPGTRSAPWDPMLDAGDDGSIEWKFDSSWGGALGLQDRFSDGSTQHTMRFDDAGSTAFTLRLPQGAEVTEAYVDIEGLPIPHWVKQYTLTPRTDSDGEYGPKMAEYNGEMWVIWQSYDENITDGGTDSDVVVRMFDGTRWDRIIDLSAPLDGLEDDIPQIIAYGGKLYAIWSKGDGKATAGGLNELVYRAYDGTAWGPETRISGVREDGLNTYERCEVYDGRLYVIWKTTDPNYCRHANNGWDIDIVYRAFDGEKWGDILEITASDNDWEDWSVDAAVYRGMLYVIWDTFDTPNRWARQSDVVVRAFDGSTWTRQTTLSPLGDAGASTGALDDALPRLHVYENPVTHEEELFAIWMRGETILNGEDGFGIVYRRFTGGEWTPMETLSSRPGGEPVDQMFPMLITYNGTLYAIWTMGLNTTTQHEGGTNLIATYGDIIIRSFDGEAWSPVLELTPMGNGYDNASHPSIFEFDGKVYAAWETPLPTGHGTVSWEIVMRHLELSPVEVRMTMGSTSPVVWGWEKLPNTKRRAYLDAEALTDTIASSPVAHTDAYGNGYVEVPLKLETATPSRLLLSNLTIEYDYGVSVDFTSTAKARTEAARDNTRVDKPVRIPFRVSTGQSGRVTLEDPFVEYYLDYPPWLVRDVPEVRLLEDEGRDYIVNLEDFFADDWDDGALSFTVVSEHDPAGAVEAYVETGYLAVRLPTPNWYGEVTVVIRSFDTTGFYYNDSNEIRITVLPVNDAPILGYIPDQTDLELDEERSEFVWAYDPDGDELRFETDTPLVRVEGTSRNTSRIVVAFALGMAHPLTFNVTVYDTSNASDEQSVVYNYTFERKVVKTNHDFPWVLVLLLLLVLALVAAERMRRPYRRSTEEQIWEEEAEEEERRLAEESPSPLRRLLRF